MPAIEIPDDELDAFCRRWHVREMALFGSVLRDDFQAGSDIDVLVTFQEGAPTSLFDLVTMEDELEAIFGREVDLIERKAVQDSPNWIRRDAILTSARPIYQAA